MNEMTPQQKAEAEADNAKAWAEAFCETFPDCGLDWGTMAGWFAMAIELSSDKRIPKSVQAEREACTKAICKHCAKFGIAEYDEHLRTWVHRITAHSIVNMMHPYVYNAVRCDAWPILARMRVAAIRARGEQEKNG